MPPKRKRQKIAHVAAQAEHDLSNVSITTCVKCQQIAAEKAAAAAAATASSSASSSVPVTASSAAASHPTAAASSASSASTSSTTADPYVVSFRIAPPSHPSLVVPDLPQVLVNQVNSANDAATRAAALEALVLYLHEKGAICSASSRLTVSYRDVNNRANALTYITQGDQPDWGVRIDFYKNAFDTPSRLYSTLRHELVHVGQRTDLPDENATSFDDQYMFEDQESAATAATLKTLQLPLQEVEAHTWELLHAQETGVDAHYLNATQDDLASYLGELCKGVKKSSSAELAFWKNYLKRAHVMLSRIPSPHPALSQSRATFSSVFQKLP